MTSLHRRISRTLCGILVAAGLAATAVQANPLVRVDTTFGSFTMELFGEETPVSVENFMHYVHEGAYKRGVVHRVDPGARIIQGGMIRYRGDCVDGVLINCSTDWILPEDSIVREEGRSNTRGTIAYARVGGQPDSASSQWFINTDENTYFDGPEGGDEGVVEPAYTVFGQVLGNGMEVVDRIAELDILGVSALLEQLPVRDNTQFFPSEATLVMYNIHEVERYSEALNVFEFATGRLTLTADVADTGPLSVQMVMIGTDPQPIFEVDQDTLVVMAFTPEDNAGFGHEADPAILRVPAIEINEHGNIYQMRNVVFRLIDEQRLRFQLVSFE